jgi:hypothetical protein
MGIPEGPSLAEGFKGFKVSELRFQRESSLLVVVLQEESWEFIP